jgi:hypothetical protein
MYIIYELHIFYRNKKHTLQKKCSFIIKTTKTPYFVNILRVCTKKIKLKEN